jgi:enoyl-[acyl-carrier-protein] reductase (NADH)
LTVTERTAALITHQAQSRGVNESVVLADFNAGNSTGKVVTAEEVADVVAFLASPKSRAINGDAIPVGGGSPRVIHY